MSVNWLCPFCGRQVSLTENSHCLKKDYLFTKAEGKSGALNYELAYIVCPNPDCKEYTLRIDFFERKPNTIGGMRNGEHLAFFQLRPKGMAKPLPDYIPAPLRQDYAEACLIEQDSPKASATLSRRCLQGIIRQYYRVTKRTLYDEIQALKGELDPELWEAVDKIREIGNVGAHSHDDVSIMVDVPPESARALIELIELMFEETYIKDHNRKQRIGRAIDATTVVKANNSGTTDESA